MMEMGTGGGGGRPGEGDGMCRKGLQKRESRSRKEEKGKKKCSNMGGEFVKRKIERKHSLLRHLKHNICNYH